MSIRKWLLISSMLLVTVAVGLASTALWFSGQQLITLIRTIVLVADAGRLALMVERSPADQGGGFGVDLRMEFLQSRFDGPEADSYFQVWAADGRTLLKSASLGERDLPRPALADHATGIWGPGQTVTGEGPALPRTENQDLEVLEVSLGERRPAKMCWIRFSPLRGPALPPPGETDEFVVVAVATSTDADTRTLRIMTLVIVAGAAVIIGVFWLLVGALIRRGLRPLSTLSERVGAIDLSGDRTQRVSDQGMSAETRPVAEALNSLLSRTARAMERERQFSDRAAHELRTPLTEIRATADVALRGDGLDLRDALRSVSETSSHMSEVLSTMLRISRRGMREDARPPTRVDLESAVRGALARHEADMRTRGVRVTIRIQDDAVVVTDPVAFGSILENLLANAAEYTLDGGTVEVVARGADGGCVLTIENGPTTLEPEDVPHLFEPFWRKGISREQTTHAGLGLTIVGLLCEDAGISIEPKLVPPSVRFSLTIPRVHSGA